MLSESYTAFAREQPGLFAVLCHGRVAPPDALASRRFGVRPDTLLEAGVRTADPRPGLDLARWSVVPGLAVLTAHGPLRATPHTERRSCPAHVLNVVRAGGPAPRFAAFSEP